MQERRCNHLGIVCDGGALEICAAAQQPHFSSAASRSFGTADCKASLSALSIRSSWTLESYHMVCDLLAYGTHVLLI